MDRTCIVHTYAMWNLIFLMTFQYFKFVKILLFKCSSSVLLKWWRLCTVLTYKIRMWLAASYKVASRISLPFGSQSHTYGTYLRRGSLTYIQNQGDLKPHDNLRFFY